MLDFSSTEYTFQERISQDTLLPNFGFAWIPLTIYQVLTCKSSGLVHGVTILQLYLKHLNPDQYKENKNLIKEKEKSRNQSPRRIAYKNAHNKKKNPRFKAGQKLNKHLKSFAVY